jgi:hypothetical protein
VTEAVDEARRYFATLWRDQTPDWRAGRVNAVAMQAGICVPFDLGLTTIARVAAQRQHVPDLAALARRLAAAAPEQYVYGTDQHHITLTGFVPRFADPETLEPARIERLRAAATKVLAGAAQVSFDLVGLGVLAAQVFVQVVPRTRAWQELRERMFDAVGERAQRFPSAAPIHMNALRVTDARSDALAQLRALVEELHQAHFGTFTVDAVDLVVTDFVMTPRHTRQLARIPLNAATAP